MRILHHCSLIIVLLIIQSSFCFDPYAILNVGKSAKLPEIRKSYKQLVKEWHPDKNNAKDAQDKFIQIQQAYEILSNEEKRSQYDQQGFTDDNTQQWNKPRNQHFRFSDFFGNEYFEYGHDSGSARSISTYKFYHQVLPDSDHTPQVIYVYSTFCGQCIVILKSAWEKAAQDLEKLGLGVGTVDTTFTTRVASSLGVSRIPTTVVIYKGRYAYYKGVISYHGLKDFVKEQLPSHLVQTLTPDTMTSFLNGINEDDRPRAVLFTSQPSPTLLYTLMALKHHKYIGFGFATFAQQATKKMADQFGVRNQGPTLLIFKENQTKPSVTLESTEMPRGAVNDILTTHRFMTMPRVTSQTVFDELCPPPNDQSFHIHLCAIYCSGEKFENFRENFENLRRLVTVAMDTDEQLSDWLKFVYVRSSSQPSFVRSLGGGGELPVEPTLYLTWRRSSRRGYTSTTSAKFNSDSADYEFQKVLAMALQTAQQRRFQREITFVPIVDELAPFFLARWVLASSNFIFDFANVVSRLSEQEFMLMTITTVFFGLMLYSLCTDSGKAPRRKKRPPPPPDVSSEQDEEESYSCADSDDDITIEEQRVITELTPKTYEELILRQQRGHMTFLFILEDHHDDDRMIDDFLKVMEVHSRDRKVHVACLDSNRYLSWYVELRRSSTAQPDGENDEEPSCNGLSSLLNSPEPSKPTPNDPIATRHHGVVLAMNGSKHWFCLFVPRSARANRLDSSLTSCHSDDDVTARDVIDDVTPGVDDIAESELDVTCEEVYSNGFSNDVGDVGFSSGDGASEYSKKLLSWRDRVLEGQMPRLYVRQWPSLYERCDDIEDDDDA